MLAHLLPFLAAVLVLVAVPGPAIVLIMKSAVLRGRRSAVTTAVGTFCADLIWIAASLAGLTALLVASRPAFEVLRFVGAAYLIYLGIRLLARGRGHDGFDRSDPVALRRSGGRAFREGFLNELSNPKTLVVFTSIIPPFLPANAAAGDAALFGLVFSLAGLGSCLVYAVAFGHGHRLVKRPRLADGLLRGSGGVLVLFGAGLATEGIREAV